MQNLPTMHVWNSPFLGSTTGAEVFSSLLGLLFCLFPWLLIALIIRWVLLKTEQFRQEREHRFHMQMELQHGMVSQLAEISRALAAKEKASGLRLSSNGQELGTLPVIAVKRLLQAGKLSQDDQYFDALANGWKPLRDCPTLK